VRNLTALSILAACLALAGCKLFEGRKGQGPTASNQPFLGSPADKDEERRPGDATPVAGSSVPEGVQGILLGTVYNRYHRPQPRAKIELIDAEDPAGTASLKYEADKGGHFSIKGLKEQHRYKLIATVRDGERVLTGWTERTTPNSKVVIYLTREGPPAPTTATGPTAPQGGPDKARPTTATGPAASLERPVAVPEIGAIPGPSAPPGAPRPPFTPSAELTGTIPGPGAEQPRPTPLKQRYTPPPPPTQDRDPFSLTVPARPSPVAPATALVPAPQVPDGPRPIRVPASVQPPRAHTPVPFCVRVDNKSVDNFALYGLDGKVWEMRKDRRGRLLLLHFWHTSCTPCLTSIPQLVDIQNKYGSYGLQVIGIAYEKGSAEEQVRKVRTVANRERINYTLLMGGGGSGPCPVKAQFDLQGYPTFVLIDEAGHVVWQRAGGDEYTIYQLKVAVHRHLSPPRGR
jgi:thiol-disulfide isomerase/thioredoxin